MLVEMTVRKKPLSEGDSERKEFIYFNEEGLSFAFLSSPFFPVLFSISCASKRQKSLLLRDLPSLPTHHYPGDLWLKKERVIIPLLMDDGYAFRLIYLCENHVLNFAEEPDKNPILAQHAPLSWISPWRKCSVSMIA